MIVISICLSDIPKEAITTSEKNGKKYASFIVDERKEKDNYGNTHSVSLSQSKEQREAKDKKVYVGNGKEFIFNNSNSNNYQASPVSNTPDDDDLPF